MCKRTPLSTLLGLMVEEVCVMTAAFSSTQLAFTDGLVLLALCQVWEGTIN